MGFEPRMDGNRREFSKKRMSQNQEFHSKTIFIRVSSRPCAVENSWSERPGERANFLALPSPSVSLLLSDASP